MKAILWLIILAIACVATVAAQPQITANGVVNAASNAPVGWPNSSIAQGSIFSIYGINLGPPSSPALAFPLQTTLGGVSVQVTSASGSVDAIPIFVGPQQINAILPDGTPTGDATLTVTYNGQAGNAVSFQVIAHSFGIFTTISAGYGDGVITDAKGQRFFFDSPANPGDVATVWGTGIGASPGDDGSAPPQKVDMPNLPLSVYVGSQAATVTYRGRSGFTGEDQINFVVPAGVTGCFAPVAVEIGNVVSNFVTMPVAPSGKPCPDQPLIEPNLPVGSITLTRSTTMGTTATTTDSGQAFFGSAQIASVSSDPLSLPADTCIGSLSVMARLYIPPQSLDAGPAITITGPNGTQQLNRSGALGSAYSAQLGGGSGANAEPLYLSAGSYTASGPGGTQVGAFSQGFTIAQPLTWTNEGDISTVNRSAGLDLTWTGGDPNGTVEITGGGPLFICSARINDQHFTIPTFVLLSVAPTSATSTDSIWLGATSTTPFMATGIFGGSISSNVTIVKNVIYQ
ncbi:MAG: hypothetical protein ABSE57_28620 [Bryobacteraceae bacterium]